VKRRAGEGGAAEGVNGAGREKGRGKGKGHIGSLVLLFPHFEP